MKTWLSIACGALLVLLLSAIAGFSFYQGQQTIQKQWDKDVSDYKAQIIELKTKVAQQEDTYRTKTTELKNDLDQAQRDHTSALAAVRSEYSRQLQSSEARAALYQRQAAAGSTSCADLAGHAARLDRSLAEGIGLVEELQRTLEFRDTQNRALGQQIRNERELFGESLGKSPVTH